MAYLSSFKNSGTPFAATPIGVGVNTVLGLPKATKKVVSDILSGIISNIASAGLTVAEPFGGVDKLKLRLPSGEQEVTTLSNRIAEAELGIKNSPLAKRLGLDKQALPLAFGGIIGSTALDLTPFGGAEKNVAKQLLSETSEQGVLKLLTKLGVTDNIAKDFAPKFAVASKAEEVDELFSLMKNTLGVDSIVRQAPKASLPSLKNFQETEPTRGPIQKLLSALDQAETSRKGLEKAYTAERSARISEVSKTFDSGSGQQAYYQALGKLKGELAPDKKAFSALKLDQGDVDSLFTQIQKYEPIDGFEKISASNGLQKILNGEIPPSSQLSLLEDIFGKELIGEVLKKRPLIQKARDFFTEVANVPRALVTSLDASAPLRQGVLFTVTKPKAASAAFGQMFRQVFSPKNFDAWFKALPEHPNYRLMRDSKLYIANPNKISGGLSAREERFMTNLAEKIPILGRLVKASERAYVSYLNKLRVDVFNQISSKFIKDGLDPKTDAKTFEALANFVNTGSGRGDLGSFNRIAQELNTAFFSPRLIASRFNLLNPLWYAKQPPRVRREAIKSFFEFVGVGASVLAIAKAGGAEVETDPRSSDFGKIKSGNSRWDIWGGFQQWVRVVSQLASGERKTAKGDIIGLSKDKYPFETRKDVAERFAVGKLAPIPNLVYELLEGQKLFGQKLNASQEVYENAVPLYIQDMREAIKEIGPEAIFTVGLPGFFGVGTQTYRDKGRAAARLNSFR